MAELMTDRSETQWFVYVVVQEVAVAGNHDLTTGGNRLLRKPSLEDFEDDSGFMFLVTFLLSLVPGWGGGLSKGFDYLRGVGRDDVNNRLLAANVKFIADLLPEMYQMISDLGERGFEVHPSDATSVINEVYEASRKRSTHEKRERLKRAMLRSFEPEQFGNSMKYEFIELIGELNDCDVDVLATVRRLTDESKGGAIKTIDLQRATRSHRWGLPMKTLGDLAGFRLVASVGFVQDWYVTTSSQAFAISDYGRAFLDFLAEDVVDHDPE
jgi:hypothetical protein